MVISQRSFVSDTAEAIQIEKDLVATNDINFDGKYDGARQYLQLVDDATFTQTIKVTNTASIAPTVSFDVEASNSPFVRLLKSGISAQVFNTDDSLANGTPKLGVSDDLNPHPDVEKYTLTFTDINLSAGQYILIKAVSEIDQEAFDGVSSNDITEIDPSFSLTDVPGQLDWGTGKASGKFHASREGFDKQDENGHPSPTAFSFDALPESKLAVSNLSFGDPLGPTEIFQSASTLRGYAEYFGQDTSLNKRDSFNREKTLFMESLTGDVDFLWGIELDSISDELSLSDNLRLLWINRTDLDPEVCAYTATSDLDEAYDILLDLINGGIGDVSFSTAELKGVPAEFVRHGLDGEGGFVQPAIAGSLVNAAATDLLFQIRRASLTMQAFQDGELLGQASGKQNGVAPNVAPFSIFAVDSKDTGKKTAFIDRTWMDQGEGIGIVDGDDGNSSLKKRIDGDEILGIEVTGYLAKDALISVERLKSIDGASIKVATFNGDQLVTEQTFTFGSGSLGAQTLDFNGSGFFDTLQLSAADADTQFTFRSIELLNAFAV